mmetsp:Transcript_19445/g.48599  ORF Transcript_19445/g.48599 Transcript_19445/m.48599 type:complete len:356 (-) Transcript_19445:20-1087(-)
MGCWRSWGSFGRRCRLNWRRGGGGGWYGRCCLLADHKLRLPGEPGAHGGHHPERCRGHRGRSCCCCCCWRCLFRWLWGGGCCRGCCRRGRRRCLLRLELGVQGRRRGVSLEVFRIILAERCRFRRFFLRRLRGGLCSLRSRSRSRFLLDVGRGSGQRNASGLLVVHEHVGEELHRVLRPRSEHRLHGLRELKLQSVLAEVLLRRLRLCALALTLLAGALLGGFCNLLLLFALAVDLHIEPESARVPAADLHLAEALVERVDVDAAGADTAVDLDLAVPTLAGLRKIVHARARQAGELLRLPDTDGHEAIAEASALLHIQLELDHGCLRSPVLPPVMLLPPPHTRARQGALFFVFA